MRNNRLFLLLVTYSIFVLYLYDNVVLTEYISVGFERTNRSFSLMIFTFVSMLIYLAIIVYKFKLVFERLILVIFYAFDLVPVAVYSIYSSATFESYLLHFIFNVSLVISLTIPNFKFVLRTVSMHWKIWPIITIVLVLPYLYVYKGNVNLNVLLLKDVYEARIQSVEHSNLYIGYSYSSIARFILPILMVYFYFRDNKILSGVFLLLFLYLFTIGAHKSFLFSLFYILSLAVWRERQVATVVYSINLLALLTLALSWTDNSFLSSFFLRRTLFYPPLIETFYFDFFKDNWVYWSDSIFRFFSDYQFPLKPSKMIGWHYFGSKQMSANNGIISDGFMNFGYVGVIINIIVVNVYCIFMRSIQMPQIYNGALVPVIFVFISSPLLTGLITHGLLAFLLVMFLIRKNEYSSDYISPRSL